MSSWVTLISLSAVRWLEAMVATRLSSSSIRSLSEATSSSAACDASLLDGRDLIAQDPDLVLRSALVLGADREHDADDPGREGEDDGGAERVGADAELAVELSDPGAQAGDLLARALDDRVRAGRGGATGWDPVRAPTELAVAAREAVLAAAT